MIGSIHGSVAATLLLPSPVSAPPAPTPAHLRTATLRGAGSKQLTGGFSYGRWQLNEINAVKFDRYIKKINTYNNKVI